jgi:hypothetical protein
MASLRPGDAGRHRPSHRVRKAVVKIRQAGPQLPSLGTRLFAFAKAKLMCSPKAGWALLWQMFNEVKAARTKSSTAR